MRSASGIVTTIWVFGAAEETGAGGDAAADALDEGVGAPAGGRPQVWFAVRSLTGADRALMAESTAAAPSGPRSIR